MSFRRKLSQHGLPQERSEEILPGNKLLPLGTQPPKGLNADTSELTIPRGEKEFATSTASVRFK